jgi:iron(III) transport system permease protein
MPLRGLSARRVIVGVCIAILLYLVVVPLAFLIWTSFRSTTSSTLPFSPGVGYTLDKYLQVLGSGETHALLLTTLAFTVGSLVVGVTIASVLAWLVERTDIPGRGLIYIVALAPIGIPSILLSISWILMLGPTNGLLNHLIRTMLGLDGRGPLDIYSLPGMIFIQGLVIVPTTFLLLGPAFRQMDPTLEEAATIAGATRPRMIRLITIPILLPAVGNTILYQFMTVVQSFEVPMFIGPTARVPVLSTRIYLASHPPSGLADYGLVSTYAVLLLLASMAPLLWYARATRQAARYATVTGRGYRPRRVSLRWWKPILLVGVAVYALVTLVLPLFTMVWMSIQPFYAQPSAESIGRITFKAYAQLLNSPTFQSALGNTLILGVTAATATTVLSVVIGWAIARGRGRYATALDLLSFAPHVVPGVVIAVSALLVYLLLGTLLPIRIHGTVWVLVIAVTTVTLGFGVRAFRASVVQLSGELEESAQVAGATWLTVMRRIVLPILVPAITNIWLWAFLSAVTGLTLVLVLFSGPNGVVSTEIYFRWMTGQPAIAAAMGVVLMTMSLGLSIVVYRVLRRGM